MVFYLVNTRTCKVLHFKIKLGLWHYVYGHLPLVKDRL
jgi:hypothetical protein